MYTYMYIYIYVYTSDDGWQSTALAGKNREEKEESERLLLKYEIEKRILKLPRDDFDIGGDQLEFELERLQFELDPFSSLKKDRSSNLKEDQIINRNLNENGKTIGDISKLSLNDTLKASTSIPLPSIPGVEKGSSEDGELSGAQIDGNMAAQKIIEKETNFIIAFLTQVCYL
jgi:hypothetical protein